MVRHSPPSEQALAALQDQLCYRFTTVAHLREALQHSSSGLVNNKKLAWLGDAMLCAVLSEMAYVRHTEAPTEALHNVRSELVAGEACARLARQLGLDSLLLVGGGYRGQASVKMMAECFEAVLGAVYVDSDKSYPTVYAVYANLLAAET